MDRFARGDIECVNVRVDDARQNGPAARFDDAGTLTDVAPHLLVGADGDESPLPYGHRRRRRESRVDGEDPAIEQHEVRRCHGTLAREADRECPD